MYTTNNRPLIAIAVVLAMLSPAWAQRNRILIPNEQGRFQFRDSGAYAPAPLPGSTTPPTVATKAAVPEFELSLDEAIQIALQNTDVVRVLSGVGAASSGQTIYSPGIASSAIDSARATFDPTISIRNNFFRNENPSAQFDPIDPNRAVITGSRSDVYDFSLNLDKRFLTGADAGLRVGTNRSRIAGGIFPLNPQSTSDIDLTLTQPLLRGRGMDVNSVPIVLAFLDTESSYFRLKNSLQNLVAGVIQGYWDLVQARIELWVVQQQIIQAKAANDFREDQFETGSVDAAQVALTAATLANFRANQISAEANILDRVASLRAILGLPPGSDFTIVPTTLPIQDRVEFDWDALIDLASRRRPDLVELKIVLEADRQRLLLARNRSQAQLDAIATYRWNGLEGEMPIGDRLAADPGQHTDWTLGVNFSIPFTLRAERASLRQNELILASDQANLQQGLLRASHSLASLLRVISQLHEQREAFRIAREAAKVSLEGQSLNFLAGRVSFVEVLLAINTWAASVTSEARAVTQLNSTLAALEAETGTILESHGVRLFEERFCSLGPLGQLGEGREYPSAMRPSQNAPRYEQGSGPSENAFNLEVPADLDFKDDDRNRTQRLPPPEPTSGL